MLPSGLHGPVTETVGYFGYDHRELASWHLGGLGGEWGIRPAGWANLAQAADALKPSVPWTRTGLIPIDGWTLMLTNGPTGTDVGMTPSLAARQLGCVALRATCVEDREGGYPARILEVFGPSGEPPLRAVRSIAAANDGGRWVFETWGEPYGFEELEAYARRLKRERFTGQMLQRYLIALGVPVDAEPDWGGAILVELGAC